MYQGKKIIIHLGALGDLIHTCKAIEGSKESNDFILITDQDFYKPLNELFELKILTVSSNFFVLLKNILRVIFEILFAKSILVMHKKNFIFQIIKLMKSSKKFFYSKKTDQIIANRYEALKISFGFIDVDFEIINFKKISINQHLIKKIGKYILISANGGNKHAKYSARTINQYFLRDLLKNTNLNIVFVGSGKIDDEYYQGLEKILNTNKVFNLSSKINSIELLALLQNSKLNILNDSFPLQLAQYTSCKALALFGPTNPNEVLLPISNIFTIITKSFCKFCYDHRYSKNSLMYNCPNHICSKFYEISLNDYI